MSNYTVFNVEFDEVQILHVGDVEITLKQLDIGVEVTAENGYKSQTAIIKNGNPGPKGDRGTPGMFMMFVDEEGNLFVQYNDGTGTPMFELDDTGDLYYVLGD